MNSFRSRSGHSSQLCEHAEKLSSEYIGPWRLLKPEHFTSIAPVEAHEALDYNTSTGCCRV